MDIKIQRAYFSFAMRSSFMRCRASETLPRIYWPARYPAPSTPAPITKLVRLRRNHLRVEAIMVEERAIWTSVSGHEERSGRVWLRFQGWWSRRKLACHPTPGPRLSPTSRPHDYTNMNSAASNLLAGTGKLTRDRDSALCLLAMD